MKRHDRPCCLSLALRFSDQDHSGLGSAKILFCVANFKKRCHHQTQSPQKKLTKTSVREQRPRQNARRTCMVGLKINGSRVFCRSRLYGPIGKPKALLASSSMILGRFWWALFYLAPGPTGSTTQIEGWEKKEYSLPLQQFVFETNSSTWHPHADGTRQAVNRSESMSAKELIHVAVTWGLISSCFVFRWSFSSNVCGLLMKFWRPQEGVVLYSDSTWDILKITKRMKGKHSALWSVFSFIFGIQTHVQQPHSDQEGILVLWGVLWLFVSWGIIGSGHLERRVNIYTCQCDSWFVLQRRHSCCQLFCNRMLGFCFQPTKEKQNGNQPDQTACHVSRNLLFHLSTRSMLNVVFSARHS